jgi:hypothetical protein
LENALKKLKEIEQGTVGIKVYSTDKSIFLDSLNSHIIVPLASAAKVAIGYCIAVWIEKGLFDWNDSIENITFNPAEDSRELYPHFQHRNELSLREAVEVMIACHDSCVAKDVVKYCGGWSKVNKTIQEVYPTINVTEDPRDVENRGALEQVLHLMVNIYQQYNLNPLIWTPIVNGLVRQKGEVEGIPPFHLNHMTGGLDNVIVDFGIIGAFNENPLIFALAAIDLPNRYNDARADKKIAEAMNILYKEHKRQHDFR